MYLSLASFLLISGVTSRVSTFSPNQLIWLSNTETGNESEMCKGEEVISCQLGQVNWSSLTTLGSILLPTGHILHREEEEEGGEGPRTATFGDIRGSRALLTYSQGVSLYGSLELAGEEAVFKVDTVEEDGVRQVVWVKVDNLVWEDEKDDELLVDTINEILDTDMRGFNQLLARGKTDLHTIVEYTVTIYYSKKVKESTADLVTFMDQVIAETNDGYKNSGIPLRVRLHCLIESDIPDGLSGAQTVRRLIKSQASLDEVRHSADVAIIMVDSYSKSRSCGVAYFNTVSVGQTIGTVRKSCALGYFSFGHEIAHGFGLAHDRRVASYSSTPFAYGNIIKRRSYRTIMAYNQNGEKRVNYYSSPKANFHGSPTGTFEEDNARRLTEVRFAAAAVGNEGQQCPQALDRVARTSACRDRYRSCDMVASSCCWDSLISANCPASCGLCPGMVPLESYHCYNKLSNCDQMAKVPGGCQKKEVREGCLLSCGVCV